MSLTGSVDNQRELQGSVQEKHTLSGELNGLKKFQGYSAYEVAVINGFVGTEEEWLASLRGKQGEQGIQGEPGTVVFEELTEEQKEILRGDPGTDGVSPTVSVTQIEGGKRISITDASGTHTFDIMDGEDGQDGATIVSLKRTSGTGAAGTTDTYTITMSDNQTFHFSVYNGADGEGAGDMLKSVYDPQNRNTDIFAYVDEKTKDIDVDVTADEVTFADGETFQQKYDKGELKGQDGENGKDGQDGSPGADGKDGTSVTVESVSESTADGGTNVVTFSDGNKLNVKNGSKGSDGEPGADGERGVTFTPSVSADGELSWTNDGGLPNPEPVNIKGPAAEFDESQIDNIIFITVEDIDEICNPQPEILPNTFQKVRAFQDGKEYILLFGYNGSYYYLSNEAFNDWTVLAKAASEVTSTDAQITFTTVPTLFTARASGSGFTLHNGENNVYAYAQSNGTGLRVNTEEAAVFTIDTSETGGFDSDEYIAKVDDDAVWIRATFEEQNCCLKFESANTSIGIDYKDRDATYATGFLSFILYEKIS